MDRTRTSLARFVLVITLVFAPVLALAAPPPAATPATPAAPSAHAAPAPAARAARRALAPTPGAIASSAPAATEAGLEILRAGGNAADAAVAVALALAVVHPMAGNLGGGGFAVVRVGDELRALDFRETAPAAATATMFVDATGRAIPRKSLDGPLAAGVPGSPAGLHALHARYGRLPFRRVAEPAIRLAEHGFTVTARLHHEIEEDRERLAKFPTSAAVWLPGGHPPAVGSTMTLPRLAATLRDYAAHGPRALMEGRHAAQLAAAVKAAGGIITEKDLAAYAPVWREPLRFRAYGWDVASMPLPSSGGLILGETTGMLEALHWDALPRGSAERAHLLAEAWRRAFADRFQLGDPSTTKADARELLDPAWIAKRAASIDRAHATPSSAVHPYPDAALGAATKDPNHTTHLAVVDGDGNAVSLTTTLNDSFGCAFLVPELGYLLNNEMDDFTAAPGQPNLYGLIQGEANAIAPGKRMLSSMAPTIATRGVEVLVLGGRGGSQIPTATEQALLGIVVDGLTLADAIARPRVHHQWLPDVLQFENGALDDAARADLEKRGHTLKLRTTELAEVAGARVRADGTIEAAGDPRGPGTSGITKP